MACEEPWTVEVTDVRAVDGRDIDAVAREIGSADLMSTAVGVNVLPRIAPTIAAGIAARSDAGVETPINIIICENLQNMGAFLKGEVEKALPPQFHDYLDRNVGFVESVVGRMAPIMTPEQKRENVLLVIVEPYKHLPVSRSAIRGELPEIAGVEPSDNFQSFVDRKLYTHNAGHAVAAYLGYLKGHVYIHEAMADAQINAVVRAALAETGEALVKKHSLDPREHQAHIDDLLARFANVALGDQVTRVGGDPVRKLGPSDRLIGGAKLALEYGVFPANLCKAIAAALRFDPPGDPSANRIQEMLRARGITATIIKISGLAEDSELTKEIIKHYDSVAEEFGP